MSHFEITGGVSLHGEVRASGSKNAALPIMAAAILASEPVRLENVPRLADVDTQAEVLRSLGLRVSSFDPRNSDEGSFSKVERNSFRSDSAELNEYCPSSNELNEFRSTLCPAMQLETADPTPVRASKELVRRMRASFCVLGPLLARRGRAEVPMPGGCNIGNRPVDLHLKGLAALGADLRLEHGYVVATAQRLTGAEIELSGPNGPTVTGTANVLCAAVLAQGVTCIHGAAVEPEIVDLGNFLIAMGAKIEGLGTSTIRIEGVDQLGGATHRLIPDRIEAATLLMAVAIAGGKATVADIVPEHLAEVIKKLREAGTEIEVGADWISISAELTDNVPLLRRSSAVCNPLPGTVCGSRGTEEVVEKTLSICSDSFRQPPPSPSNVFPTRQCLRPHALDITAEPYPGIPTDLQAQWTALLSLAEGTSRVEDRVFPGRFLHVAELNRLGANISCGNGMATVTGVKRLSGARVTACDLRASAALVLVGLAAEGRTIVEHIHHLDRGYEQLDEKLRQLGARITRVSESDNAAIPL